MKIVEKIDIIAAGDFPSSAAWRLACRHVEGAVKATDWPHGTGTFTIYPESGKKFGHGNGVVPIKMPCVAALQSLGWVIEDFPKLPAGVLVPGDLDALYESGGRFIAFEWETGNISSSHRAINKLLLILKFGGISGGFLVVPSDKLKVFLTDRIGNIKELRPYFPLWQDAKVVNGAMQIIVVEHDATSKKVRRIPKTTAGRSRR